MRIVQVTDTLQQGGAERVAVDLSNWLFLTGHDVFFCATRKKGPLEEALNSNIQITCLDRTSTFSGIKKFRNFILVNKIDIVHAHGNSTAQFCIISLFGLPLVKIVHHDHNPILADRNSIVERIILARADRWIVVSKLIMEWVLEKVRFRNAKLILNPINTNRFHRASTQLKKPVRVVALSNYRLAKNYENLIEAARIIKEKNLEIEFLCYGSHYESDYFNQIKILLNRYGLQNIVHLNPPTMEVPQVLETADIGVLFSSQEGLPISLLEYMASSLPVVVTDVGDCGKVVRNSECGEVVNPNDPIAFVKAIENVIGAANRNKFGDNGREYVEQHHSIEVFGTVIINDIYKTL